MRAFVFLLVFPIVVAVASCAEKEPDAFPNVRLGMSPRDVRERFEPGGPGTWQTSFGASGTTDDTALEWSASGPSKIPNARFEFHLGMLVAMRVRISEPRTTETISTTAKTVTLKRPAPEGGSNVTVLARDCPTHKDEAEALVRRGQ